MGAISIDYKQSHTLEQTMVYCYIMIPYLKSIQLLKKNYSWPINEGDVDCLKIWMRMWKKNYVTKFYATSGGCK